jgi:hypothetical protein
VEEGANQFMKFIYYKSLKPSFVMPPCPDSELVVLFITDWPVLSGQMRERIEVPQHWLSGEGSHHRVPYRVRLVF